MIGIFSQNSYDELRFSVIIYGPQLIFRNCSTYHWLISKRAYFSDQIEHVLWVCSYGKFQHFKIQLFQLNVAFFPVIDYTKVLSYRSTHQQLLCPSPQFVDIIGTDLDLLTFLFITLCWLLATLDGADISSFFHCLIPPLLKGAWTHYGTDRCRP